MKCFTIRTRFRILFHEEGYVPRLIAHNCENKTADKQDSISITESKINGGRLKRNRKKQGVTL